MSSFSIMVVITLSKLIDEKILLLQELMNASNKSQVNSIYRIQIDTITSMDDYDLQNVESTIL